MPISSAAKVATIALNGNIRLFNTYLKKYHLAPLQRAPLTELQVNVGKLCNQACNHCHVDAGPKRTEIMSWNTMVRILKWAEDNGITAVDITGGAPELNPHFRDFVDGFLKLGCTVTSRCNLTVLWEPEQEDLAKWYSSNKIRLVCSLPCYTKENVDAQRGKHVFDKSIRALQTLNQQGYGHRPELVLDLVYNPGGAYLPPPQQQLERDYKEKLAADHNIVFNNLISLSNLPISRFRHYLEQNGELENYQKLLIDNFNPETVPGLMCRHLLSVDWRGYLYDCDFNQMLEMPMAGRPKRHLWDVDATTLEQQAIAIGDHCFGCTAGSGSSCGGALV